MADSELERKFWHSQYIIYKDKAESFEEGQKRAIDLLKYHNLINPIPKENIGEEGGDDMYIDAECCALCELFNSSDVEDECVECPLLKIGHYCNDQVVLRNKIAYKIFIDTLDEKPMLKALKEALKFVSNA